MEVWQQDLFFWKLVKKLVTDHKMRIVEISSEHHEVWLEDERFGKNQVLRLVRANLDWANHVRRLLEQGALRFEMLRKRLFWRRMNGVQVVVMNLPTVDSSETIANQTYFVGKKKKTLTRSIVIENGDSQKEEAIKKLFSLLDLEEPSDDWRKGSKEGTVEDVFLVRQEMIALANKRLEKEKAFFSFGKPRLTYLLLIVQMALFFMLERNGGSTNLLTLIEFGAKYNPLIEEGQWWRFFTAMFLHIGFLHLLFNSFALYVIGSTVEKIYGSARFFVIYFSAGLLGSILSYAFTEQVSAGASGAIYGCFGALLYIGVIQRTLFFRTIGMSVVLILLINLSFGLFMPMIDNNAHLGGLLGGFLASMVVHLPNHQHHLRQIGYFFLTAFVMFGFLFFGMNNDEKYGAATIDLQIAHELIEKNEYLRAKEILLDVENPDENVYFLLSYAEIHLEEFEQAKEHLLEAIAINERFHEAYYNLALVFEQLGEYDRALEYVGKAVHLNPKDEKYEEIKRAIEKRYGNQMKKEEE